jgi:hypothetical protein
MWLNREFVSYQFSTGFADPRGHETGFVGGQAEPQVSPLRFAPVEMTILLENWHSVRTDCFLSASPRILNDLQQPISDSETFLTPLSWESYSSWHFTLGDVFLTN